MWKHLANCPKKQEDSGVAHFGRRRVRSLCAISTPVGREISDALKNVVSLMNYDDVTRAVHNDVYSSIWGAFVPLIWF